MYNNNRCHQIKLMTSFSCNWIYPRFLCVFIIFYVALFGLDTYCVDRRCRCWTDCSMEHLVTFWTKITKTFDWTTHSILIFLIFGWQTCITHQNTCFDQMDFLFSILNLSIFWFSYIDLITTHIMRMFRIWHRNEHFQIDQNQSDLRCSLSNITTPGTDVFVTLNMPHIDEKDSKPPMFTRKTPKYTSKHIKWTKIHFFSDRQNIENRFEVCWVDPMSHFFILQNQL